MQSRSRARCSYLFLPGLVRGSLAGPGSGSRGLKTHLSRTCFRSMWRPLVASGETKTRRTIIDVTWLRENLRLVVRLPALASSAQHPKLPFERNCRLAPVPAYIYNRILPCTMLVGAQEMQYICQPGHWSGLLLGKSAGGLPRRKHALEWGPARNTAPDPPAVPRTVPQAVYRQEL